jgi:hypothetical protein
MRSIVVREYILGLLIFAVLSFSGSAAFAQQCHQLFDADPSHTEFSLATQKTMDHLEASLLELYQTSGFKNDGALIQAVEKTPGAIGELYREAWELLGNEKILVGTRLPSKIREKIAKNGFLNSHETEDSQGSVLGRAAAEADTANFDIPTWDSLPNDIKPKFAAAYPKFKSKLSATTSLNSYTGKDRYYFNIDKIRDRLTVTPGDSFNRYVFWRGFPSSTHKPISWDQIYVPWKHRALMIPVLAEGLKEGRLGLPKLGRTSRDADPDYYGYQQEIVGEGNLSQYKMQWNPNMDYLELQIWGKLTLDDVEVFEYHTSPPKGSFLKELQKRGIKIRDGRKK